MPQVSLSPRANYHSSHGHIEQASSERFWCSNSATLVILWTVIIIIGKSVKDHDYSGVVRISPHPPQSPGITWPYLECTDMETDSIRNSLSFVVYIYSQPSATT